jgi:lipoate-protein ligase A|tara:strand:+ start:859 stop:1311 length:453 start_codon:yes stop_codon:yes gene_type:complete
VLWVDVILPRGDDLWDDDVARSGLWLGDVWAAVLGGFGLDAEVHRGHLVEGAWSEAVCFAGRGPGEVSVGGRKLVGTSQRRTREGAWFQCAVLLEWRPREMVDLLGLEPVDQVTAELEACAVGLVDLLAGDSPSADALASAFVAALLETT